MNCDLPVNIYRATIGVFVDELINIGSSIPATIDNNDHYAIFNIISEDCTNAIIKIYFEDTEFYGGLDFFIVFNNLRSIIRQPDYAIDRVELMKQCENCRKQSIIIYCIFVAIISAFMVQYRKNRVSGEQNRLSQNIRFFLLFTLFCKYVY